jgi:hypothetical protein
MAQYAFDTDEYVVLNAQQVHIDTKKSFGIPRDSELMLTNRNIVFPIKGITGKVKDYQALSPEEKKARQDQWKDKATDAANKAADAAKDFAQEVKEGAEKLFGNK